jgi:hypothetical protein
MGEHERASGWGDPAGEDGLSADLARLVGDTRAADAARSRARERSMRQQEAETATLAGVLLDLAEQRIGVAIRTTWGRSHHGQIAAVGRDFVHLRTTGGTNVYLSASAIAVLRRLPGQQASEAIGARPGVANTTLAAFLSGLAPERPLVSVTVEGEPSVLTGELRAVGTDVVTLRLHGAPSVVAYVGLSSLSEVAVLASG